MRVAFARSGAQLAARLGELLRAIPGLKVLEAGDAGATLEFAGGPEVQSEVLRLLVVAGLAVTSFTAERENLHQSYLRTVAAGARQEGEP